MIERLQPNKSRFIKTAMHLAGLASVLLMTGCSAQPVLTGTLVNGGSYRVAAGERQASQVLLASGELAWKPGLSWMGRWCSWRVQPASTGG
jgi:hypothetical protein